MSEKLSRSAAAPTMGRLRSSLTVAPERAPRLRRIAEIVELQAAEATDPAAALEVARAMRLRAVAIELGARPEAEQRLADTLEFMAAA